jgi:RNA polymerase sigma-70 factor, ECF subfamily
MIVPHDPDSEQSPRLAERLRGGDPRAADEVFARYARRLALLAERRLSRRVAARVDGEDVVQSVFRTFFRRCARGEFHIDGAADLWRLLLTITVRKARANARRHTAERRDVHAEAAGDAPLENALAGDPGPGEAAALVDQIEALLRGLPPWYARLLDLRLQGRTAAEAAAELAVSRQTVYRALDLLRQRLADAGGP